MMRSLRPSTISLWNDLHLSGQRLELLALLDNLQHASGLQVGMLEIVKEGEESQWGKFGDPDQIQTCQHLLFQSKSNKTGLQYYSILYHREGNFYPAYRFFTTGSTGRLNLVVTITIPGKLVALGGGWWSRAGGERDGAVRLQALAQGSEALRRRPQEWRHQIPLPQGYLGSKVIDSGKAK